VDQNVSGALSICGFEFRLDEFKVMGIAASPARQEIGFVPTVEISLD
jgi:hypothetical protein